MAGTLVLRIDAEEVDEEELDRLTREMLAELQRGGPGGSDQ